MIVDAVRLSDPLEFARLLEQERVTVLFLTTALFNLHVRVIPGALANLRVLLTGGERADPESFARLLAQRGPVRLSHCYGPTESTVFALAQEVTSVTPNAASIPIGRPIGNTTAYVLQDDLRPAPIGVVGELYLGGDGLALGYLRRAELTAERFIRDPFSTDPSARLYRTGDLASWRADGTVEFVGRNDAQVKIRGFRVELGEVESCLTQLPGVSAVAVLLREDEPGEKRLVAYYTGSVELEVETLRGHARAALPEYMVPAAYVHLAELPLTAHGKLDRRALPAPEGLSYGVRAYEAPVGELEQELSRVWSELLRVERVGRHDNFFELGGHSLSAVQLVSRVRSSLRVELGVAEVFAHPVLLELAERVGACVTTESEHLEVVSRAGVLPLSLAQQRLWFLMQLDGESSAYHMPLNIRIEGELDRSALRAGAGPRSWRGTRLCERASCKWEESLVK